METIVYIDFKQFVHLVDAYIAAKSLITKNPLTLFRMDRHAQDEVSVLNTFIPFVINNARCIYTNIYSLVLK